MIIYGLVGKSGTGKSYQAMNVCHDRGIEAIIDDGLFICGSTVEAGHSAKRDANKLTAVKTAIFNDEEERARVAGAIREVNPESILVLGTSTAMIEKICRRLELPEVTEMIHIEDIVSEEDLIKSKKSRSEKGMHVIPVPSVELKRQFSGYFMAPLVNFFMKNGSRVRENPKEKTVVRPTYSYLGDFTISDRAVIQLVTHVCEASGYISDIHRCYVRSKPEGVKLVVNATFYYSRNLKARLAELQQRIGEEVENMTAFNIRRVNIEVKTLKLSKKPLQQKAAGQE